MKNVLFIVPNFPPLGGISVQRTLQLIKGLPKKGYRPIIITVEEADHRRLGSNMDKEAMADLEHLALEIHRVGAGRPSKWVDLFKKLRLFRLLWIFAYPRFWERFPRWPHAALQTALQLIDDHDIDIIYSSSAPYTAMQAAYMIKRSRPEVAWVNDIRDPWTEHFGWQWPSYFHWLWSRGMERRWMKASDKIVVVSEEMKNFYVERILKPEEHIKVLTNAFG